MEHIETIAVHAGRAAESEPGDAVDYTVNHI